MNYFIDCQTIEEIKKKYRKLAFENHPDHGGSTAVMQEINRQYLEALKMCDRQTSFDENGKEHTYYYNEQHEREILEKIAELIGLQLPDNIKIALIGKWVWIVGTQREDIHSRDKLKEAGCEWHSKRRCWYWKPYEHRGRYSKNASLSDLAYKYGAKIFEEDRTPKRAAAIA